MIKNDYIMRMIEQLSAFLVQIAGFKAKKQYQEGRQIINEAIKELFGLHPQTLVTLDYKDLMMLISTGGRELDQAKNIMLSELLKENADLYDMEGNDTIGNNLYFKSLNIFIEVLLSNDKRYVKQCLENIQELIPIIQDREVPDDTQCLLFQYYEYIGEYGKAEDLLYELLESNHYQTEIVNKGIDFYKRLTNKDQCELIKGNLPLDEVVDGLNQLQEFRKQDS